MIILIAESKTMETEEVAVSTDLYERNCPEGEKYAAEIMGNINEMSVSEIVSATKMSVSMAGRLKQMAYEFPNKNAGLRAIGAFTGVVFKNFGYDTLSAEERGRTENDVRIISSLYGWLRPNDIIKPYRLEYTSPLSPDETMLWKFWRGKVTVELVKALKLRGDREILNLLPADAAKCIDWKLVKNFAKVWKVDFLEQNGETVRSPHAGRLKALRGELLREVVTGKISSITPLHTLITSHFLPIPDYKYSDRLAYFT